MLFGVLVVDSVDVMSWVECFLWYWLLWCECGFVVMWCMFMCELWIVEWLMVGVDGECCVIDINYLVELM